MTLIGLNKHIILLVIWPPHQLNKHSGLCKSECLKCWMVSIHPVSLGLLGASISEEKVLEQHDSQSTFEGMFTVNLVVRALSARRLLHLGGPHLQGVLRLCPRSASWRIFLTWQRLRNSLLQSPECLLGWWGGQITTRIMCLFKQPN